MASVPQKVMSRWHAFAALHVRDDIEGPGRPRKHATPPIVSAVVISYLMAILACSAGCVTTNGLVLWHDDSPPKGTPAQVNVAWHNQVIFAPDPVRGGMNSPGLVGRLYLFGPDMGYPFAGDGQVTVDLFDPSQPEKDGNPKHLERWVLRQDMLAQCLRRDTIGWGYTLLLPWGTYRPDLAQVVLKVRYDPPKGVPIYTQPANVTFNPVQDLQVARSSRPITPASQSGVVPASHAAATGNH